MTMQMRQRRCIRGLTYLELITVLAIAALVVGIAVPSYRSAVERAKVSRAIGEIGTLEIAIESFRLRNEDRMPANLGELNVTVPMDPWGREYVFYNIRAGGIGGARKDARLIPLNTDFDLYSLGKDGASSSPLSARTSQDDILRANNGDFIGLGKDY